MQISAASISSSPRWPLIWRVGAALTLIVFALQWQFFLGDRFGGPDLARVWGYVVHHAYILAWMLLVTSFTRTLPLRTLAAFWFVGVFPVMALTLLITRPMDELLGGGELVSAVLAPLVEELVKGLPVLAFLAYRVWRRSWQLSATDGLLLGYVVGAGFAFHEDAAYDRIWGSGFDDTTFSFLFPTISEFRGSMLPGHDSLNALIGLGLGFGFLFRRYRFAWVVPVAAWLIVVAEHITGNLEDIAGNAPLPAEIIRGLLLGGQALIAILVIGIVAAVVIEWRILKSIERQDPLFPPIPMREFLGVLRQRTRAGLRRLQAMRVYARQRRSVYYTVWSDPAIGPDARGEMVAALYSLGIEAGVPVEETFAEYDRAAEVEPSTPPATEALASAPAAVETPPGEPPASTAPGNVGP
jgi:RsiW-degrading membrane proteinase PrsW (M82 family)